jgi:hypothetical protein
VAAAALLEELLPAAAPGLVPGGAAAGVRNASLIYTQVGTRCQPSAACVPAVCCVMMCTSSVVIWLTARSGVLHQQQQQQQQQQRYTWGLAGCVVLSWRCEFSKCLSHGLQQWEQQRQCRQICGCVARHTRAESLLLLGCTHEAKHRCWLLDPGPCTLNPE